MMKKAMGAVAALVLALAAGTVSAVEREGAFTVSPMIGLHYFDNEGVEDQETLYSLGVGYNFTRNWSVEAMFSYAKTHTSTNAPPPGLDVDVSIGSLSGLYHFDSGNALVPYVGAGVGYRNMQVPGLDDNDTTIDFIGGLKYFLTPKVAMRLDARYLMDVDGDDEDYDDFQIQAGLQLLFGVPTKMPMMAPGDGDGDGVTDDKDRCPNTPKGVIVGPDGCPLDSDGDGVFDSFDKCPGTPRGAPVDANGCPLDSDGDGVPDYLDKCPNTPAGTKVDADGCPIPVEPVRMELRILFDFDKSNIRPEFYDELAGAGEFMAEHPTAVATIEGHTDSIGTDAYNQKLSERRAASVRDHLINVEKVSASRLRTVGYGETRPIATNDTAAGRQQNRRVISVIIETR